MGVGPLAAGSCVAGRTVLGRALAGFVGDRVERGLFVGIGSAEVVVVVVASVSASVIAASA